MNCDGLLQGAEQQMRSRFTSSLDRLSNLLYSYVHERSGLRLRPRSFSLRFSFRQHSRRAFPESRVPFDHLDSAFESRLNLMQEQATSLMCGILNNLIAAH